MPVVPEQLESDPIEDDGEPNDEVFFVGSDGEFIGGSNSDIETVITKSAQDGGLGSNQLLESKQAWSASKDEIIAPPINLYVWAQTPTINTRLAKSISVVARNTVGLGWNINTVQSFTLNADTPEEERLRYEEERAALDNLFGNPNPLMPFTVLMELVKTDVETIGNGYVEVVTDGKGIPTELYHVQGTTVRILREMRGFVQIKGNQKRYFRRFGDDTAYEMFPGATSNVMDSRTGRFVGEPAPGSSDLSASQVTQPPPPKFRATALMHFKLYSTANDFYGLPRYVSAILSIAGNRQAGKRNLAFFKNDAVPRMAVIVEGGKLGSTSLDSIKKFFAAGKGVEQAHRLLVLQADKKGVGIAGDSDKTKISIKPLTVNTTDDASFQAYRHANDEEVRESFGLAQTFFTTDVGSRAAATVAKKITDEQEFEPERVLWEHAINHTLLRPFDLKYATFKFQRPTLIDPLEQALSNQMYTAGGVKTVNEIRNELGYQPFPSEYEFADKPLRIALEELKVGASILIEGNVPGDYSVSSSDDDVVEVVDVDTDTDEFSESKENSAAVVNKLLSGLGISASDAEVDVLKKVLSSDGIDLAPVTGLFSEGSPPPKTVED